MGEHQKIDPSLSLYIYVDEHTARARVLMLNRMKRNLISEWHPIIDVLLGDYTKGLKRIDVARDGPDDDVIEQVNHPIGTLIGRNYTPPSSDDI